MFRRLPPELSAPFAAFERVAETIERGKDALLSSVPTTRLPGRPLADTLVEFEAALSAAVPMMEAWRHAEVEEAWVRAAAALAAARIHAELVRLEAPEPEGFEALVGAIGDLLAPLDAFHDAAERFSRLRRWRR